MLTLLALATAILAGTAAIIGPAHAQQTPWSRIEQGRYLALAGDCAGCHTVSDERPFAGGKPIPTPFGTIYSANLTPDRQTGIGNWSADDFYNAMHRGIDAEGKHLYPAFPYPWFTRLTRDDVDAIRAWLATVEPVKNEVKTPELPWPLSWRASLTAWNALFLNEGVYRPDPVRPAQWNRGAYLVEAAGHCGACHKPKNLLGATDSEQTLVGGDAGEHWYAPDLTNDLRDGLGEWSIDDIVEYLKTGSNARSAAAGSMKEVIARSTQHLTRDDLRAIATYLKDQPGDPAKAERSASAPPPAGVASTARLESAADRDKMTMTRARGEAIYVDNCTGCHMGDGKGLAGVFPPLDGASVIRAETPDTVIQVVVAGQRMVQTQAKPSGLAMPAFADKLTDEAIADVVSFIRGAWSNHAPDVDPATVATIRAATHPLGADASGTHLNRVDAIQAVRR